MSRNGLNNKGGRPRGSKTKATLEKEKVMAAIRQRTLRNADLIYDSQLSIARGVQFLYKIEKEWIPKGKSGWWKPKKPILVEDEAEIRMYIEGLIENGDTKDVSTSGSTYYYITTKEPNNSAIDSMFDRAFGKPTQSIDHTSNGKELPTPILNVLNSTDGKQKNV